LAIIEVIKEIENRSKTGDLSKKRFTCIHCGRTWIEFYGLIVVHKEGSEDMCLHIGMESENCFACNWRTLTCEKCDSKDVYEIVFSDESSREVPLSLKNIKTVSNRSNIDTS
jgi:hypothetical protein